MVDTKKNIKLLYHRKPCQLTKAFGNSYINYIMFVELDNNINLNKTQNLYKQLRLFYMDDYSKVNKILLCGTNSLVEVSTEHSKCLKAKQFYLLLYSLALRTVSLSPLKLTYPSELTVREMKVKRFYLLLYSIELRTLLYLTLYMHDRSKTSQHLSEISLALTYSSYIQWTSCILISYLFI